MRLSPILRVATAAAVLAPSLPGARAATSATDPVASSLASPGDYSFAPPPSTALPPDPPISAGPHGVVSTTVGNRGEGGSVAMDSGLIGGTTHVFLEAGGGQDTPWRHGPTVTDRDVGVGVSTVLPDDTAIMLQFGTTQSNWTRR